MKNDSILLKASSVLFVLNVLASALNYLCQLLMAKVLSVESYGTVNTIFSFMMIVAVPGTTLTMVVAKYYASDRQDFGRREYLKKQVKVVLGLTAVVALVLACISGPLAKVLSIDDVIVLVAAFLLAALGYFQPLYSGVFSGNKKFVLVGIYSMFIPIYKLASVFGAYVFSVDDKIRLYMVLILMNIGLFITIVYGHLKSFRLLEKDENRCGNASRLYEKSDFNALFLNVSLMVYMNIDLLSVRYYGGDTESGLYSSVLLFGRIIYYFSTTLGTILLPSVADTKLSDKERRRTLDKSLILLAIFTIICILPVNLIKGKLILILFGEAYQEAIKYVIYVSLISLALSFYTIMTNYVVGIGRTSNAVKVMIVIDIVLLVTIVASHSVDMVLMLIGIVGLVGAITMYLIERLHRITK